MHRHLLLGFALSACGEFASTAENSAVAAPEASHRLLGILDPDRGNTVAFAMRVPADWQAAQAFTRKWDGAVAQPQVSVRLRSPDGRSQIEYRPAVSYLYSDGPVSRDLRAQMKQFGMDPKLSENELPPMLASTYAREMMIPRLAKEGIVLTDLRNEQEAPEERVSAQEVKRRGSIDGTLADGQLVRVECRLRVSTQQLDGETFTSWTVVPSITQSADDLEATHAHTRTAQDSIVWNPEWQKLEAAAQTQGQQANSEASRRQHEATMNGIQQNTEAMTAGHNARMADIQSQGAANTARYNERMDQMDSSHAAWQAGSASQDRQHEYAVDTIRGEHKYADPTTGEQVKVQDGSNHVYRDTTGSGVVIGTQAPLDSSQVDWQELQRLTVQEY